jgi:hypothetical protein
MKRYIKNTRDKFDILAKVCINNYVTDVEVFNNGVIMVTIKE